MSNTDKSRSAEQLKAEDVIFSLVEKELDAPLQRHQRLSVSAERPAYIRPDFYSQEHKIIGEIFAHIGKPKKAQNNKIANDILKMLLFEKHKQTEYLKVIAVCDEAEYRALNGDSALAESIRRFGIKLLLIPLEDEQRDNLLAAQARQRMVNE